MELIKLYRLTLSRYVNYKEGENKQGKCITLWNDKEGLTQSDCPYFTYTPENRVGKGTNPFIK